jgi:DNA repair protein RecO (recombination protein O)
MNRGSRRVALAQAYLLHHRPYRDTSRILEVWARDHGRLTLFARGVRGGQSRLASVLQPFRPLLLSWSGRGESPTLSAAEPAGPAPPMPPARSMAGFYLNELVLKLSTRHDPMPALFDDYHTAIDGLKSPAAVEPALRVFEKRLLEALGYGVNLREEALGGRPVEAGSYYHFKATLGFAPTVAEAPGAYRGSSLLDLEAERLADARSLEDARRLLRAVLDHCLEGQELCTRTVARSMSRRGVRGVR